MSTSLVEKPKMSAGKGGGSNPPRVTTASADGPDEQAIEAVLHKHDIPGVYWKPFKTYANTCRIVGADFRQRVNTLTQFKNCLAELKTLTRRDYPTSDGSTFESYRG